MGSGSSKSTAIPRTASLSRNQVARKIRPPVVIINHSPQHIASKLTQPGATNHSPQHVINHHGKVPSVDHGHTQVDIPDFVKPVAHPKAFGYPDPGQYYNI